MRISESRFRVTDEVKQAAKLRAEAEARRVIQEAEMVTQERAAAKAKARAEIGMLAAAARAAANAKAEAAAIEEARIDATGKDEWFYLRGDEQFGPVTLVELREMVADPNLESPIKLVWAEGMSIWRPVYEVRCVCDPEGTYDIRALMGEIQAPEVACSSDVAFGGALLWTPNEGNVEEVRKMEAFPRVWDPADRERAEVEIRLRAAAEAKALEEAKMRVAAEDKAVELERLKKLAEAKAAEESRTLVELMAKAREEAQLRMAAEAKVHEEARLREVAEARVRTETRRRAAAEARAAEEERIAAAARVRAEEEAKAKVLVEARAAEEAQAAAAANARALEESRLRKEAELKAAEEARRALLAKQRADEESRAKALVEARAVEEARVAACEKARAEEESRLRREAEARASHEARQAAMARARAENEEKARAELAALAAEEARSAAAARALAEQEMKLRHEAEAALEKRGDVPENRSESASERKPDPSAPIGASRDLFNHAIIEPPHATALEIPDDVDQEAMLNAEIDALAEQEAKLEALAKERAEKETRARAEVKSRASQATRAAIAAKRKVRRQVLARAMESARLRELEVAATALMAGTPPAADLSEPGETTTQPPSETVSVVTPPSAPEPQPLPCTVEMPEPAPLPAIEPAFPPAPSKPAEKRRHSFLSGKKVWYYTCEGERVGPVTFEELKAKAADASLNPRLDLVWKKGGTDWQQAGRIEGLFPRQADSREVANRHSDMERSAAKPKPRSRVPGKDAGWPGARRRSLLLVALVLPFAWELGLRISQPWLVGKLGEILGAKVAIAASWVPLLLILHFGLKRLANLGMSRWWYLALFAPFVNLWVAYRCFACPSGYAFHRKLDAAGFLLALVYWMIILAALWFLLGFGRDPAGWGDATLLKARIGQTIQQFRSLAAR